MLAARAGRISTSPTMKVAAEAIKLKSQGIDVIDFGAGEPDFPTPRHIGDAAKAAIDANFTKYTTNSGTEELKNAVVARYREDYGVEFSTSEVIITAGGKQALYNAAMVLFGPGDDVITHMPGWPTLVEQIKLAEATPIVIHTRAEDGFNLKADAILAAVTPRTKGIILNSPGNPTGALITEDELATVAGEAAKRGIWILVDLCYEKLIYDPVPHNLVKVLTSRLRDRAVICGSASKAYSVTGWRCGWTIAPKEVVAGLLGSQDCVTEMLNEYRRRRDQVCEWLAAEPRIRIVKPAGAFYLFPDVGEFLSPDTIRTTAELGQVMLAEARVAITPGEAFDSPGFFRLSYATSMTDLQRGTARILEFMRALESRGAAARA